jgi:hypothetical protein
MKHQATKVTGGCLCGRVRYEAHVFLDNGYICHCTICRRSTGQPAELTVLIKAGTLRYLKEQPKYYISSQDGKRGFCGHCGSRLVWQALRAQDDWLTNITVGTLDRPQDARMSRHIYADTQLPWYKVCEDLPKLGADDAELLIALLRKEVTPNV